MRVTQDAIRQANRLRILQAIQQQEQVSRTDLTSTTGLAAATVSEIIAELLAHGVLLETRSTARLPGRPRLSLQINPACGYVAGVFTETDGVIEVEIANLRGDRLAGYATVFPPFPDADDLADQVAQVIDRAIGHSGLSKSAISCVGVSLAALVDSDSGIVHWMPPHPAAPQPLADKIEARVGLPAVIDNVANVIARGERWFGDGRDTDDFSIIAVGPGVALAQYVNGRLKNTAQGVNSEFGHLKLDPDGGRTCSCGARGCLNGYASAYGVVSHVHARIGRPIPSFGRALHDAIDLLVAEARAGDASVAADFAAAGRVLGIAVANHIMVTGPAKIILVFDNQAYAEMIAPAFHASVEANTLPALRGCAEILFKSMGATNNAKGAAALGLERLYRSPELMSRPQPLLARRA